MKGTPIFTIMAISGHKDVKTFKNYVKSSGKENADIMRNAWKERGKCKNKNTKTATNSATRKKSVAIN